MRPMIALVGQPNCGKSTLFNNVAGYKASTGNFPGVTVSYTKSEVTLGKENFTVIDLPGIYSLSTEEPAEMVTLDYLLKGEAHLVIDVIDSTTLGRSLELTLQLMELESPLIVCLNMIDEAEKKGILIDPDSLEMELGVPAMVTVASKGIGVKELFVKALEVMQAPRKVRPPAYSKHVEEEISSVESLLKGSEIARAFPLRFLALKLLEGDKHFLSMVDGKIPGIIPLIEDCQSKLEKSHGHPASMVISGERHALALHIFERVAKVEVRRGPSPFKERIDDIVMHPFWGYLILLLIFAGLLYLTFFVGSFLGDQVTSPFERLIETVKGRGIFSTFVVGMLDGIAGGVGIVLPYLLPLLFLLSLLEDVGYLPRAAYLLDGLMHKMGLHGKSVIPFVLGYGCNVPAIMAARIIESPRDRVITLLLASLVPCPARTSVILGLQAKYLGPLWALALYLPNILVLGLVGFILSKLWKGSFLV